MKKSTIILFLLLAVLTYWWISAAPPNNLTIGSKYILGAVPATILKVESKVDIIANEVKSEMENIPGHDDIAFQDSTQVAYLSGIDGWIWKVDGKTQTAQQFAKVPLIPTGMQFDPKNPNRLYFCASRMGNYGHSEKEKVGLYALNIENKKIEPVILRLPKVKENPLEMTFLPENRPKFFIDEMKETNSREFCLCNDLAISRDGQRIYMSEPVPLPRASMGSGAVIEAIGLAPIGKLWLYDLSDNSISLVVDNFTFVDGLILSESDSMETAVLFSETTKFRILKTYLTGEKAGSTEVLWSDLPGMPDGMDRDRNGNIWIGLIKKRSGIIGWIHKNRWIKPFFLRLPQSLLPVSKETGILALSPNGRIPLYFSMHDGSNLSDISVVCPRENRLYFPIFNKENKGWFYIKNPIIQ